MKQEEKNRLMRARIMDAAFVEFGDKSYAEASVNTICEENNISKGILYHYYESKEAIYLACVKLCYEGIMDYLRAAPPPVVGEVERDLSAYFEARLRFFEGKPHYQGVFYQASLAPPQHLKAQVEELRLLFDRFNVELFSRILEGGKLRSGVTPQDVGDLLILYQNFANSTENVGEMAARSPRAKEEQRMRWVHVLLHGVLKESE